MALMRNQQRREHSKLVPQELCPPFPCQGSERLYRWCSQSRIQHKEQGSKNLAVIILLCFKTVKRQKVDGLSSSVQSFSPTLCDTMDCSTPGLPVHHQVLELTKTHVHQAADANCLILCCPPLLLLSVFPCIRVFSSMSFLCIRWPKYWSFSFSLGVFQ